MARVADRPIVSVIPREDFLSEIWDYKPGDAVTVLAPMGGGKTQLSYQLLGATATPDLPAIVFVMKPRDSTVTKFSRTHGYRTVRDWPPAVVNKVQARPPGWVLWPKETDDPDADERRHTEIFRRAIRDSYSKGSRILFADETYSLEQELNLEADLRRVWTKGRSLECGLWAASQRPVYISQWAFQAQHLFLGFDPDVNAQRRYGEIGGGVDPAVVRATMNTLERYQFIYINREERAMCIVDK